MINMKRLFRIIQTNFNIFVIPRVKQIQKIIKVFFNYFLNLYHLIFASNKNRRHKITHSEIKAFQKNWSKAFVKIGTIRKKKKLKTYCSKFVDKYYNKFPAVLFKPTLGKITPRRRKKDIMSFFITKEINGNTGFALNPWKSVEWNNTNILIKEHFAICMGHYKFISNTSSKENIIAEYSFVLKKSKKNNKLKLILHHSSIPYESTTSYQSVISHISSN